MFGTESKPAKVLLVIFLLIMAYLPVHALVSTWGISNFGNEIIFKAWKGAILFFVAVPVAAWLVLVDKKLKTVFFASKSNLLILAFAGLCLVMALFTDILRKVMVAGLVFDLRYFAMFIVGAVLALKIPKQQFVDVLLKIIFWGGVLVVVFGALQVLLLPNDFLRHFGYRESIIPAYFMVDNNPNIVRILSTLRGPNALGAYLVFWLPFLALATKRLWAKSNKYRFALAGVWLASIITLFGSRSRSGWLGATIAIGIFILLSVNNVWRKRLVILGIAGSVLVLIALALNWNSPFVQTTLKHRDPGEQSAVNSDDQRTDSLSSSVRAIANNPLGYGPGTVNLASTYGDKPVIVENYYLQIAQQYGLLGLVLFITILVLVALKLWQLRGDDIAVALLSGFGGMAIVNLLLPGWSDETVSMLWWGLAGVIISLSQHSKFKAKKTKETK